MCITVYMCILLNMYKCNYHIVYRTMQPECYPNNIHVVSTCTCTPLEKEFLQRVHAVKSSKDQSL